MEQRVAVVTGAGAGIGTPIAERLGKDGHYVVLADRDVEAATDAAQKMQAVGYGAHALRMDVGELESIDEALRVIARDYGRCDVLVNNAGVARTYAFLDYPDDDWHHRHQLDRRIPVQSASHANDGAAALGAGGQHQFYQWNEGWDRKDCIRSVEVGAQRHDEAD